MSTQWATMARQHLARREDTLLQAAMAAAPEDDIRRLLDAFREKDLEAVTAFATLLAAALA